MSTQRPMTRPPIRRDQHGTITGYTYGCRCEPCCDAMREYRLPATDRVTNGTVRQWGMSLGLPIKSHGALPQGLIDRWNREHPDRPYLTGGGR